LLPPDDMVVSKWVIELGPIYVKLLVPLWLFVGPQTEKVIFKDPVFMGVLLGGPLGADRFILEVIAVYPVRVF